MRWRVIALACTAFASAALANYHVQINGDRVTIRAENAPLRDVLSEFARVGVRVKVDPRINARVDGSAVDMKISGALDRMLRPHTYALLWDVIPGPVGKIDRLSEIHVFGRDQDRSGTFEYIEPDRNFRVERGVTGQGPAFVADEILLAFKAGTDVAAFHALIGQIGGTVMEGASGTGVYRIRLPRNSNVESLVESLGGNPVVARAEPNYVMELPPEGKPGQPVEESPRRQKPERVDGVPPVAILDSGLNTVAGLGELVTDRFNAINPSSSTGDRVGHGTQMALIASGAVLPGGAADGFAGVPIVSIRAFDDNGTTSNFTIMRALEYAASRNARVINMSWGSETPSEFLRDAIHMAQSRGMIVVASSGNQPTGKTVYPAAYPGVVSTSALESDGTPWPDSNFGGTVSLAAPGTAQFPVGHKGPPGAYAGTSISAAYVSRQLALYLSRHPDASPSVIRQALEKALTPMAGNDLRYGKGKLDEAALNRLFGTTIK